MKTSFLWRTALLVFLCGLLFMAAPAHAAVAHVSVDAGFCTGSVGGNVSGACGTNIKSQTFTHTATGTGNGVIFFIACSTATAPTAVSLTATGWTLTQVQLAGLTSPWIAGNAADGFAAAFTAYAPNTSSATFTMTWTTTATGCGSFMTDLIDEFSGMDITNFVDISAQSSGASGCSLSITPVTADDGVWFGCLDNVTAIGAGFTAGANDTQGDRAEWAILTGGAGTPKASAWTSSGTMTIIGVAIKPAGAGGGRRRQVVSSN